MLIKSFGTTTWTDAKTGCEKSKFGPQYIHFVDDCFNHGHITVDSVTLTFLNEDKKKLLQDLGVNV